MYEICKYFFNRKHNSIYGDEGNLEVVMNRLDDLMKNHSWEDIRVKARMIHSELEKGQKHEDEDDSDEEDLK